MYARYALAHSALCDCLRLAGSQRPATSRRLSSIAKPSSHRTRPAGWGNVVSRSFATYVRFFIAHMARMVYSEHTFYEKFIVRERMLFPSFADPGFKIAVSRTNDRRTRSS